jgi:polysaccharide biosynthesis protein PelC
MRTTWAVMLCMVVVLSTGCLSKVHHGGSKRISGEGIRIYLPPLANATDDEHAGRALSEITATALLERGLPIIQTEPVLTRARAETAAGPEGLFLETARSVNATHLLIGTVHEYRYKTDLDGDPAVGVTLRLVDAQTGLTLWQGSSGRVSVLFASLTKASQTAVRKLVRKIPVDPNYLSGKGNELSTRQRIPSSLPRNSEADDAVELNDEFSSQEPASAR